MDIHQLETFLAVADEKGFSRAAKRLHRTQPAVSQVVRKLEGDLGEVLFERTARDGTLTAAGEVLRDYARRVVRPVCRELARSEPAGAVPRGAPMLLIRHPALLAEEARRMLGDLLARYEVLRAVVEFRDSLQRSWNTGAANQGHAVQQLRDWCVRAEASGIRALREFALRLRDYSAVAPA